MNEDGSKSIIQVIVGNNGTVMSTSWVPVGTNSNSQDGGSISPTPAPTQEPAPSATRKPVIPAPNLDVQEWAKANKSEDWSKRVNVGTKDEKSEPNSIVKGNIYRDSNGDYYVASKDQAMSKDTNWPANNNDGWLSVKIGDMNLVYTVKDLIPNPGNPTQKHIDVKYGDIFKYSDTEIYIRQYTSDWVSEPHVEMRDWIRVNLK